MFVDLSPLMCPKLTSWFSRYSSFLIVGTPSFQWLIQIPIVMLDFSRALIFFTQFISESCWLCLQKKTSREQPVRIIPTTTTLVQATVISQLLLLCPFQAGVLTAARRIPWDVGCIMPHRAPNLAVASLLALGKPWSWEQSTNTASRNLTWAPQRATSVV